MGTLSGGNGGGSPPDGGGDPFDGLPDLPPEWGVVVIPDDPGELAAEAAEVRRELRRDARRGAWGQIFGLSVPPGGDAGLPSLRLPILIMTLAVLAAMISMFALGWQREVVAPGSTAEPQRTAATTPEPRTLPALDLVDGGGGTVSLRSLVPSVILLTDGCDCGALIEATIAAAPPTVIVVTVARTSSPPAAAATGVRSLGDPTGELRQTLELTEDERPVALLVDRTGEIVRALPGVNTVEEYRAGLASLAA
jgi:hypothetical protein